MAVVQTPCPFDLFLYPMDDLSTVGRRKRAHSGRGRQSSSHL